jgi:hypothetical protein
MVGWIETYIDLIGTGISIGALIISSFTLVLLVINAILIWHYVKETKRQADATKRLAEDSRAEFKPNVQVVFKEREFKQNGDILKGVYFNIESRLVVEVDFINISKGITAFNLELCPDKTHLSAKRGPAKYRISTDSKIENNPPIILKPKEKTNRFLVFSIGINRNDNIDRLSDIPHLVEHKLTIAYRIKYNAETGSYYEGFCEIFTFNIEKQGKISDPETVLAGECMGLIGKWSNVTRTYYKDVPELPSS